MARTVPIAAEQPPEATWKAAGQVVTLAGAEVAAVQVAASITLAALLWPLIPAVRAAGGLAGALGQWPPPRPLPEQQASAPAQAVVVMARPGGAGRAATVPGGAPGAVRAAGAVTLGVEEEFVLLDPCTGAAVLAGPDLVRMLDGNRGVRPELMRFQVETGTGVCPSLDEVGPRAGPAAAAGRGRRGAAGLPAGGLGGRAVPRARAGRDASTARRAGLPQPPEGPAGPQQAHRRRGGARPVATAGVRPPGARGRRRQPARLRLLRPGAVLAPPQAPRDLGRRIHRVGQPAGPAPDVWSVQSSAWPAKSSLGVGGNSPCLQVWRPGRAPTSLGSC